MLHALALLNLKPSPSIHHAGPIYNHGMNTHGRDNPSPEPSLRESMKHPIRLGCVSYLNAKPLIESLDQNHPTAVKFDVPSRLLDDLLEDRVDVALCPVIDLFTSPEPLVVVPGGCIGCDGPTLTVRLYSQVPIEEIQTIHADTDSHTSVALLQLMFRLREGRLPKLIDYHARERVANGRMVEDPEAMLLIGDKVVTDSPAAVRYPHQLDLGEAWKQHTGLPFVFAVWMTRPDKSLGDLPQWLDQTRQRNLQPAALDAIVQRYASTHGWPDALARQYLGEILHYTFGPRQLEAITCFADHMLHHHMLKTPRAVTLYDGSSFSRTSTS